MRVNYNARFVCVCQFDPCGDGLFAANGNDGNSI